MNDREQAMDDNVLAVFRGLRRRDTGAQSLAASTSHFPPSPPHVQVPRVGHTPLSSTFLDGYVVGLGAPERHTNAFDNVPMNQLGFRVWWPTLCNLLLRFKCGTRC